MPIFFSPLRVGKTLIALIHKAFLSSFLAMPRFPVARVLYPHTHLPLNEYPLCDKRLHFFPALDTGVRALQIGTNDVRLPF